MATSNPAPDGPVWSVRALTLYPEMFPGFLGQSLAGRAMERGIWSLETVQIRDFATDKHHTVDDIPYGGGVGMVMKADVVAAALDASVPEEGRIIYPSPRGRVVDQTLIRDLATSPDVTFLCGRFEGLDQRVLDARPIEEVSLGDFVLSGGEVAALAMMDAVIRLLPGVMGKLESADEESFEGDLLEYPLYTRPPLWEGRDVPEVLMSGHHGRIAAWRQAKAEEITKTRRPDLWDRYAASTQKKRD